MKIKKNTILGNIGEVCPKCGEMMQRRTHLKRPKQKTYYFEYWDVCLKCRHIQHYEKFKKRMSEWRDPVYEIPKQQRMEFGQQMDFWRTIT